MPTLPLHIAPGILMLFMVARAVVPLMLVWSDERRRAREEHRDNPYSSDYSSEEEAAEDARKRQERSEDKSLRLYRKASDADDARHTHSWSRDDRGAGASLAARGAAQFRPDQSKTVDELKAEGWRILGGVGRMVGSPGESEVAMIHLGRAGHKGAQKAQQLKALVKRESKQAPLQVGARGGQYYVAESGQKVYVGK